MGPLQRHESDLSGLGIYCHIPFCARRCDYCDFFVVIDEDAAGRHDFFGCLLRDLHAAAAKLDSTGYRVDSIYLGGGTPSYVPPAEIASVLSACRQRFVMAPGAEITLEANPESVTVEKVAQWLEAGVNRLSLGVQSFDDRVLGPRGRLYTATEAERAARIVRQGGIENLGIDLIAGLPGETTAGFLNGIERALALCPSHVSVYLIETDDALKETRLTREVRAGREHLAGEDETVEMYETAIRLLTAGRYRHYEISNFARPGLESTHNMKYWTGQEYLGLGPSAHSSYGGRRFGRPADLSEWRQWVVSGRDLPPEADYTLADTEARAREALVLSLRLIDGVVLADFASREDFDPSSRLKEEIAALVADQLALLESGRLRLSRRGILMANDVFARLT